MRPALIALVLGLCLAAAPVRADDEAELSGWKQRLEDAEAQVAKAHERADAALAAYEHMRHSPSVRGEEKAKIIAERAESEHALGDAQAQLDSLREQARRAGVPPAWIEPDAPAAEPEGG